MEFWIFMILFIFGGGCSLTGTWWVKKNKKK